MLAFAVRPPPLTLEDAKVVQQVHPKQRFAGGGEHDVGGEQAPQLAALQPARGQGHLVVAARIQRGARGVRGAGNWWYVYKLNLQKQTLKTSFSL